MKPQRPTVLVTTILASAMIIFGCDDDGATTSAGATTSTSSPPAAVPADEVIRGNPYMGVACASPDALSCDRVGVAVRLTEPARQVTATLGGSRFALDSPDYSAPLKNGEATRFAGYLDPAGLREPGPLHVLGQPRPGRDRWLDSAPNKFPLTLEILRRDGSLQTTKVHAWLAPGWG